jgi:hypothetical protein
MLVTVQGSDTTMLHQGSTAGQQKSFNLLYHLATNFRFNNLGVSLFGNVKVLLAKSFSNR